MTSRLFAMLPADLRRVTHWWWREASRRLPRWLRAAESARFRVVPTDDGYRLSRQGPGGVPMTLGLVAAGRPLPEFPRDAVLELALAGERLLTRQFSLPSAATQHLRQVVGLDLDRRTPLRADQAYFAASATSAGSGGAEIEVTLSVMPKATARPHLEALAAVGLMPAIIVAVGEDGEVALPIDGDGTPPQHRPFNRMMVRVALAGGAVVLLLFALQAWRVNQLESAVAAASGQAGFVRTDLDQIDALRTRATFATTAKNQAPAVVVVLEGLSRVLPDDTWLTNFRYDNEMIHISGTTGDSAALLRLIDESPQFEAAQFRSAVVRDSNGKDRFDIVAKVMSHATP